MSDETKLGEIRGILAKGIEAHSIGKIQCQQLIDELRSLEIMPFSLERGRRIDGLIAKLKKVEA